MEQIITNMTAVDKKYQEELARQNQVQHNTNMRSEMTVLNMALIGFQFMTFLTFKQVLIDRLNKRKAAIQKINELEEEVYGQTPISPTLQLLM